MKSEAGRRKEEVKSEVHIAQSDIHRRTTINKSSLRPLCPLCEQTTYRTIRHPSAHHNQQHVSASSVCSVRANEVGSLKHEVESKIGSLKHEVESKVIGAQQSTTRLYVLCARQRVPLAHSSNTPICLTSRAKGPNCLNSISRLSERMVLGSRAGANTT